MRKFCVIIVKNLKWEVPWCTIRNACLHDFAEFLLLKEIVGKVVRDFVQPVVNANDCLAFIFCKVCANHWLLETCDWLVEVVKAKQLGSVKVVDFLAFLVDEEDPLDAIVLIS
jgi:hypothetical protein